MRTFSGIFLLAANSLSLIACVAPLEPPDLERFLDETTGAEGAVRYRSEEEPLDVPEPIPGTLTLSKALHLTLRHSASLQASLSRVRMTLAEAEQARLLPNPVLDLIFRFPEGGGRVVVDVGLSTELILLLRRPQKSKAADSRLFAAAAESVSRTNELVAELRNRYAAVQALDELLPLLEERRQNVARLVSVAQDRLEGGFAARIDVTTLRAQLSELDLEIGEKGSERKLARLRLTRLLGEPSGDAGWTLEAWPELPKLEVNETLWITTALKRRPELQQQNWELEARIAEARLAGLSVYDGAAGILSAEREDDWSFGPGISLPLPLFDTGDARKNRAAAAIAETRHEVLALKRVVVEEVRRAFAAYEAAQRNLDRVRDDLIPLQRQRRAEIEDIYLSGLADVTALLFAEQDLQASQVKMVELEERAASSLTELERVAGGHGAAATILGLSVLKE